MPKTKTGDTVAMHYTGRLEDGTVFDSSHGRAPLEFTIGEHHVIAGFENGALDMEPGDEKTITLPPDEAYGPFNQNMVATFPPEKFPPEMQLHVGDRLQLRAEGGQLIIATITEITDDAVTLDANHELAGKTLIFDLQLVEIKN